MDYKGSCICLRWGSRVIFCRSDESVFIILVTSSNFAANRSVCGQIARVTLYIPAPVSSADEDDVLTLEVDMADVSS